MQVITYIRKTINTNFGQAGKKHHKGRKYIQFGPFKFMSISERRGGGVAGGPGGWGGYTGPYEPEPEKDCKLIASQKNVVACIIAEF